MLHKPLAVKHSGSFLMLPDGVFLQQQFDKLSGDMQGEHALCHLLQDPQVVAVSGGEPVCARHDATKHYKEANNKLITVM